MYRIYMYASYTYVLVSISSMKIHTVYMNVYLNLSIYMSALLFLLKKRVVFGVVACICLVSITDYSCTYVGVL